MNRSFRVLIFACAGLLGGCGPRFRDFTSQPGNFAVKMPGNPTRGVQTTTSPSGPVQYESFTVSRGSTKFVVTHHDLPQIGPLVTPWERLEGAVEAAVRQGGGRLIDQKNIALLGSPGREVTIAIPESQVPGGGLSRARMLVVGRKFYQVVYTAPKSQFSSPEANKFLDSFALLGSEGKPIRAAGVWSDPTTIPVDTRRSPAATSPAAGSTEPASSSGRTAQPTGPGR